MAAVAALETDATSVDPDAAAAVVKREVASGFTSDDAPAAPADAAGAPSASTAAAADAVWDLRLPPLLVLLVLLLLLVLPPVPLLLYSIHCTSFCSLSAALSNAAAAEAATGL